MWCEVGLDQWRTFPIVQLYTHHCTRSVLIRPRVGTRSSFGDGVERDVNGIAVGIRPDGKVKCSTALVACSRR